MASASNPVSAVEPDLTLALRGEIPVAAFVRRLAATRGVMGVATDLDIFALDVSRLSDAQVAPDRTEDLLAALVRERFLSSQESMRLQAHHIRQQDE